MLIVLLVIAAVVAFVLLFTNETKPQIQVTKEFAASQLIGGDRFLKAYDDQLKSLSANKRIADYFYLKKANERFQEVQEIVKGVVAYGKQASAHISIYYAMYLYE